MARNIPGGIDLTAASQSLVMCIQVTDILGTVLGFTEHDAAIDRNISDGNGTVTYEPGAGGFLRSAAEARSGGRVGSMDIAAFLDSSGITESKAFAGLYDSALVRMFLTDWTDASPSGGIIWVDIGELEETNIKDDQISVTFKSLLDRYHAIKVGNYFQDECFYELGTQPDDISKPFAGIGCRVQLNPPAWEPGQPVVTREDRNARPAELSDSPTLWNTVQPTDLGTVGRYFEAQSGGTTGGSEPSWGTLPARDSTVNDNGITWIARQAYREPATILSSSDQSNVVVSYAGDAPDDWYQRGRIEFTSGTNIGISRHIKSAVRPSPDDGTLLITTWTPIPLAINDGSPNDTVILEAGCDHRPVTCIFKFRNFRNYAGFSLYAPVKDEYFKIPKQTT